jgi:hypothetical protein
MDLIYQHKFTNNTYKVTLTNGKIRIGKQIARVRFIKSKLMEEHKFYLSTPVSTEDVAQEITYELTPEQQADIVNAVTEALELHDF